MAGRRAVSSSARPAPRQAARPTSSTLEPAGGARRPSCLHAAVLQWPTGQWPAGHLMGRPDTCHSSSSPREVAATLRWRCRSLPASCMAARVAAAPATAAAAICSSRQPRSRCPRRAATGARRTAWWAPRALRTACSHAARRRCRTARWGPHPVRVCFPTATSTRAAARHQALARAASAASARWLAPRRSLQHMRSMGMGMGMSGARAPALPKCLGQRAACRCRCGLQAAGRPLAITAAAPPQGRVTRAAAGRCTRNQQVGPTHGSPMKSWAAVRAACSACLKVLRRPPPSRSLRWHLHAAPVRRRRSQPQTAQRPAETIPPLLSKRARMLAGLRRPGKLCTCSRTCMRTCMGSMTSASECSSRCSSRCARGCSPPTPPRCRPASGAARLRAPTTALTHGPPRAVPHASASAARTQPSL